MRGGRDGSGTAAAAAREAAPTLFLVTATFPFVCARDTEMHTRVLKQAASRAMAVCSLVYVFNLQLVTLWT